LRLNPTHPSKTRDTAPGAVQENTITADRSAVIGAHGARRDTAVRAVQDITTNSNHKDLIGAQNASRATGWAGAAVPAGIRRIHVLGTVRHSVAPGHGPTGLGGPLAASSRQHDGSLERATVPVTPARVAGGAHTECPTVTVEPTGGCESPHKIAQGKRRKLMNPQKWMKFHPFVSTLEQWSDGVSANCGEPWSAQAIAAAVSRGPHTSALTPEARLLIADEMEYQITAGFSEMVT